MNANSICSKEIKYFTGDKCWYRLCALRQDLKIDEKSHDYLLFEIEYYLEKYKIDEFEFTDYCNVNIKELDKLCRSIAQKKLSIKWTAPVLIDMRMKYDFIERMKQAGCEKVIIELFSASDDLLKKIGAGFSTKDVLSALKAYKHAGIDVGVNLVFGHPLERQPDRDDTINFLHENIDSIGEITNVALYPETSLKDLSPILTADFINFISELYSLNKPIIHIYPAKAVFDEFERSILRNKDLCLYFNKGKGDIFLKGLKLTSGLGLYTSIFANSFWQDSEHADWKTDKINNKKMILTGKWHALPIIQKWEVELKDEGVIRIKISIEFSRETLIEGEQQINIMLRNEYNKWSSRGGANGLMPSLFNDDWPVLFEEANKNINTIKAETDVEKLPLVSLIGKMPDKEYCMAVLNASAIFNSRVLKGYRISNKKYSPGKHLYFDGEIQIESRV